jgi:hypothetical protein
VPHLKTGRHTAKNSLPVRPQTQPGWAALKKTFRLPILMPDLKDKNASGGQGDFFRKTVPLDPLKNFYFY